MDMVFGLEGGSRGAKVCLEINIENGTGEGIAYHVSVRSLCWNM